MGVEPESARNASRDFRSSSADEMSSEFRQAAPARVAAAGRDGS
jgi:hypothetical protein